MQTVHTLKVTYENQMSGLRTIQLPVPAEWAVRSWLEAQGKNLEDTARSYRRNKHGLVTFKTGVGYATIDADLLGGNGDGLTERRFERDTNTHLTY